jgi:hypothetical protein
MGQETHAIETALPVENEPAWHNPVTAVSADVAQYMPGGHEWQNGCPDTF